MADSNIDNTETDTGSPVDQSLLNRLRDNAIAMINGDSGAPRIQTNALNNSCVNADKIATNAVGESEIAQGAVHIDELAKDSENLTGGIPDLSGWLTGYMAHSPRFYLNSTDGNTYDAYVWGQDTGKQDGAAFALLVYVQATRTSGTENRTMNWSIDKHIASPPYSLGHGDCQHFIYARQAPNGDIKAVWDSGSPAWSVMADEGRASTIKIGGDKYLPRPIPAGLSKRDRIIARSEQKRAIASGLDAFYGELYSSETMTERRKGVIEQRAIDLDQFIIPMTPGDKNEFMEQLPHRFNIDSASEDRVIMLEPSCALMDTLGDIAQDGDNIGALLYEGDLAVGDAIPDYNSPTMIDVVKFNWK